MRKPRNPRCGERTTYTADSIPGVTLCEHHAKEVMVVPTAWWHATCNLEDYTFGIGGQDSCDLADCPGYENADHMHRKFCWTGEAASQRCFGQAADGSDIADQTLAWARRMEQAAEDGPEAYEMATHSRSRN